jgi:methyl-accepting chemotaxis protein
MIENTLVKVEQGSAAAKETATALHEIVENVDQVRTLVGDIAQAANEQAQGVSEVGKGLAQIDRVTQQNTAAAEESAAAADELSHQSDVLHDLIAEFRLLAPVQPAWSAAGLGDLNLSPDMLRALQAFLIQQQARTEPFAR